MPKEVLHLLYHHDEAKSMILGEPIHIETHGIAHVVIQLERKRYPKPLVVEQGDRPLIAHAPVGKRRKTAQCRFCNKPLAACAAWKHEAYCDKNPKRTKRRTEL